MAVVMTLIFICMILVIIAALYIRSRWRRQRRHNLRQQAAQNVPQQEAEEDPPEQEAQDLIQQAPQNMPRPLNQSTPRPPGHNGQGATPSRFRRLRNWIFGQKAPENEPPAYQMVELGPSARGGSITELDSEVMARVVQPSNLLGGPSVAKGRYSPNAEETAQEVELWGPADAAYLDEGDVSRTSATGSRDITGSTGSGEQGPDKVRESSL